MFVRISNIYYNSIIHIFAQKYAKKWEADHNWLYKKRNKRSQIKRIFSRQTELVCLFYFNSFFLVAKKGTTVHWNNLWGVKCFQYYFIRCVCVVWFGFAFCFVVLQTMLWKNRTGFILLVTRIVTNCTFPLWSIAIYSSFFPLRAPSICCVHCFPLLLFVFLV